MPDASIQEGLARVRRSPDEVRRLLLESAAGCFGRRGYTGTTTREIAQRAGVSEALLFRHFGTKSGLFVAAVVAPFAGYLNAYLDRWGSVRTGAGVEELTADYVGGLFDLLREHHEVVLALLAAYSHESDVDEAVAAAMRAPLARLRSFAEGQARLRKYLLFDAELTPRVFLATVVGMAVVDDWFTKSDRDRQSRDSIVREMTSLLVDGLDGREQGRAT